MTNFGWWADQVPEGYFLCCMCFTAWMFEFALIEDGERVDICWACGVEERRLLARKAEAEKQPGPQSGPSEASH